MKSNKIFYIIFVAAVGLLTSCGSGDNSNAFAAFFAGGAGQTGTQAQAVLPVVAAEVTKQSVSDFIITTTTLDAEYQIDVIAQAAGQAKQVLAEEGDKVKAGDLLAVVDQSEALLDYKEAQAHFDNYSRIFDRTSQLVKTNSVSNEEYESQRYNFELKRIALEKAKTRFDNTEIRAPIDGVVTSRSITAGAMVSNNANVFSIADFDPLQAYIHVPEREISRVRVGQIGTIRPDAYQVEATARVSKISPIVNASSGTVKVTMDVYDRGGTLKPGMFVEVFLPTETREDVLVIPKKAITIERDQEGVFVIADGVAERREIETGLSEGDLIEVVVGLNEGERIITVGQSSVRVGQLVRVAGEPAPTPEPMAERAPVATPAAAPATASAPGEQAGTAAAPATPAAAPAAGGAARAGGGGGFDLSQLPADRRKQFEDRLLENPEVKKAYDEAVKEDPELKKDDDKRAKFFTEQMAKLRESGGGFGGR